MNWRIKISDFIEEFYYGNIEPQDCTTELKSKVMECLNELAQKEKHLIDTLTDEDKELFNDYVDTYIRFLSICNTDSFIAGFRLGARFTYDTFVKKRTIEMTEITYTRNGDYYIPDIVLKEKERKPLSKYGRTREDYLKNHRPALWIRYLLKDTLDDHLHEIDSEAQNRFDTLLPLYCERYGVTEELKATNQTERVRRMNNIVYAIEEIILTE